VTADATTPSPPADPGGDGTVPGENAAGSGKPWWQDLSRFEGNINSRHGEDGVLARILEFIPPKYKIAVEIGAGDGHTGCNCRRLAAHPGQLAGYLSNGKYTGPPPSALECWNIIAIDNDPKPLPEGKFPVNEQAHWQGARKGSRIPMPTFHPVLKWQVTYKNVNHIAAIQHLPNDFDLLSIDIEGQDFWVWEGLQRTPRIVAIAFNGSDPGRVGAVPGENAAGSGKDSGGGAVGVADGDGAYPPDPAGFSVERDPKFKSDGSDYFGASFGAMKWLGNKKGYALLHQCGSTMLIFVLKSLLPSDFVEPAVEYSPMTTLPKYTGTGKWVAIPEVIVAPPAPVRRVRPVALQGDTK